MTAAHHPYSFDRVWRGPENGYDYYIVDVRSGRTIYESRDGAAADAEWNRLVAEWKKEQGKGQEVLP